MSIQESLIRTCPKCDKKILYKGKSAFLRGEKEKRLCRDCSYLWVRNKGNMLIASTKEYHSKGMSNREIAKQLNISSISVAKYLRVLGLKSNEYLKLSIRKQSDETAECSRCHTIKTINDFQYGRRGKQYEYRFSYCNSCRKQQCYLNMNSDKYKYIKNGLNKVKRRAKNAKIPFDLDFEYIKNLYDSQKGLCFYTGIEMNTKVYLGTSAKRNSLSYDKIIPELGYVKGNVVLCSNRINAIKRDISLEEMKAWMPGWYRKVIKFKTKNYVLNVGDGIEF